MVGLLSMVILVGLGERMAERFLPVYLVALGAGPLVVGFLNALDNLLSAIYSFPGGYVAERYGTKKALLLFNLIAMFGFIIVIVFPSWQAVIIGAFFFLSWTAISLPASMNLVSHVLPSKKHTMGVTMHSLFRRFPMAVGPLLGGALIDRYGEVLGVRLAFCVALFMALVALVMQQVLIQDDRPDPGQSEAERRPWRVYGLMPAALKSLLISDILVRFCEQIPYAFVVLWCLDKVRHPVTALQFGILTTVEMATAILIYIPVAYLADRGRKKPFVAMTFGFFTIFPLVLLHCQSYHWLLLAFVVRGFKEFGEPTRKTLIMELAPKGHKAQMFGLYYLLRDIVVSVAAFLGGFLWQLGPAVNFKTAFVCGLLGTLWFIARGQDLPTPSKDADDGEADVDDAGDDHHDGGTELGPR